MQLEHIGTETIQTERLEIRRFRENDNASMRSHWVSDISVQKMYSEPAYTTEEEVRELLNKYIEAYRQNNTYRWAITLRDASDCIGQIAYFMINDINHWGEIEYCVGRAFQNKGYITEAVNGILEFGFEVIKLHKVQVCHKANNPASKRVIEKCGFVYEGALRDFFFMDNQYVDRLYYSMLQPEWEKLHSGI